MVEQLTSLDQAVALLGNKEVRGQVVGVNIFLPNINMHVIYLRGKGARSLRVVGQQEAKQTWAAVKHYGETAQCWCGSVFERYELVINDTPAFREVAGQTIITGEDNNNPDFTLTNTPSLLAELNKLPQ